MGGKGLKGNIEMSECRTGLCEHRVSLKELWEIPRIPNHLTSIHIQNSCVFFSFNLSSSNKGNTLPSLADLQNSEIPRQGNLGHCPAHIFSLSLSQGLPCEAGSLNPVTVTIRKKYWTTCRHQN